MSHDGEPRSSLTADDATGLPRSRAPGAASGLDRAIAASVPAALRFLAPLYLLLAVSHLFVLRGTTAWAMSGLALGTSLVYGGALLHLHRAPLDPRHGHFAAAGTAALVLVNCSVHLVLVGEAADTTNILIFMVGAGFLLLSRPWLVASLALAWAGWALAAWWHPGQPWGRFVFALVSASVLAAIVHNVRVRTVVRLEDLRLGLEDRVLERTRELETANRLLRTVVDHLPDAVTIRDVRGATRLANEAAGRLPGPDGVAGALRPEPGAWSDLATEAVEDLAVIRTGEPVVERAASLGDRHFVVSKYPVRDSLGQVTGVLDVRRDVTEARRQDEARRQMEQRLQGAQKLQSLGVLTGGIAHDFNNLLTGVLGATSLIRLEPADSPRLDGYVAQIEAAAAQAAELCRQMLAYAGQGRTVVEPGDVNRLVQEAIPLIRSSASRQVDLRLGLAASTLPFAGDLSQIRQIVVNLVINAAEALTDRTDGVIEIATGVIHVGPDTLSDPSLCSELSPGPYVFVEVTDNGCGMTRETQQRIFEPFFTTKFTGRGLGLAVVLGIARGHRGTVRVYSEPGRGSTFRVLLPYATEATVTPAGVDAAPAGVPLSGTALLIDDEATVRDVVSAMLRKLDLTPVVAEDGRRGLELYRVDPDRYRVVIVDLTMPVASGRDVLRDLRAHPRPVPVLLMSGFSEGDIALANAGPAREGFLQKPFSVEDLRRSLASLLDPHMPG